VGSDLAAWLGLVPRQITTGGKLHLVGITKRGNKYLRKLLIHGARSALPSLVTSATPLGGWPRGLIATAIVATVGDASLFRSGRELAPWLGLTPRQRSTGGKQRLDRITHQGDAYIRRLLIIGAQSALQCSREMKENAWVRGLLGRCTRLKIAVALANKTARIVWALMAKAYHRASTA
jgi:transposase